jgi:hypothetical protein
LALRAADFAAVQGFDAGFLNSQEDVDLCLRLLRLPGRKVCVSTPATTVVHSESVAPGRLRHTRWSRQRFVKRWHSEVNADDEEIYAADGIVVASWKEDSESLMREGIGAGRAVLQRPQEQIKATIVVHIFYLDLWPEISQYLSALPADIDLHITCCPEKSDDVLTFVKAEFPTAELHIFPNEGMDVLPFLRLLPELKHRGYDVVCKLHTKRGIEPLGTVWRQHLLRSLVADTASLHVVLAAFRDNPNLALAGPAELYVSAKLLMYENRLLLKQLHQQLEPVDFMPDDWGFFAGSMFWVRVDAMLPIAAAANQIATASRCDQEQIANGDGSLAHALERALGWAAHNHQIGLISSADSLKSNFVSSDSVMKIVHNEKSIEHLQRSHVSQILSRLRKACKE